MGDPGRGLLSEAIDCAIAGPAASCKASAIPKGITINPRNNEGRHAGAELF
jgi:hypothetical protein